MDDAKNEDASLSKKPASLISVISHLSRVQSFYRSVPTRCYCTVPTAGSAGLRIESRGLYTDIGDKAGRGHLWRSIIGSRACMSGEGWK